MEKRYTFENRFGSFTISTFDGVSFTVSGSIKATESEFKKIHRMPPNKYGNFFGREKAGFSACRTLIESKQF